MKLYLWDIDGTLVAYRGAGRRAAEEAFADVFSVHDVAARTRGVHFAGATDGRILREMAAACGIDRPRFDARLQALRASYLKLLQIEVERFAHDPVLPAVRSVLASLHDDANSRLALLTGNYEPGARIKLERAGLNHYFSTGGFGDDHEERRIVASAARARSCAHHGVDVAPCDVIVVGDTIHDVDCARANGFYCIAVCTGSADAATLQKAGADLVLRDLTEWRAP